MTLGRVAITVTVGAWLAYIVTTILRQFVNDGQGFRFTMEAVSYMVVVTLLTFSALMYLVARQGALYRFADHRRVPRGELDRHFAEHPSAITVLVPSYAEEPEVVRSTLWSAALQEFPSKRVVLLIDDPPYPGDEAKLQRLEATRALTGEIEAALAEPHAHLQASFRRYPSTGEPSLGELRALADDYAYAAEWLEAMGQAEDVHDHVSEFFVEQVLGGLASDLRLTHTALWAAVGQSEVPPRARVEELRRRLLWIFSAEVTSFERKRYASLSHEANKAMNINAYISLMGRRLRIVETGGQEVLRTWRPASLPTSRCPTPSTSSPSMPTRCCCATTACGSCTCSGSPSTSGSPSRRRRTPRSAAHPPAWSGSPGPPPTCSTSSIRA